MGLPHHLATEDYMKLVYVQPDYRIQYLDEHPDQFGELYVPPGDCADPSPVVVFIHGGCWQAKYGLEFLSSTCDSIR